MAVYLPGSATETENRDLAAALLRMGVNLDPRLPFKSFEREHGPRRWVFYFQPMSADRRFITEDLVKVWNDSDWMRSHANHPWAVMRGAFAYREELDKILGGAAPLAEVNQWGVQGFLSLNADDNLQQEFFRRLKRKGRRR